MRDTTKLEYELLCALADAARRDVESHPAAEQRSLLDFSSAVLRVLAHVQQTVCESQDPTLLLAANAFVYCGG